MDLIGNLFSIALYVLQALGLYTIAKRRGIRHAWLAWVPIGSAWILGSVCDDFKTRCDGKKHGFRIALLTLTIVVEVLLAVMLVCLFSSLFTVLTTDEVLDIVAVSSNPTGDLYTPSEDELIEQLTEKLDQRLTDERVDSMLASMMAVVGVSVLLCGTAIAMAVVECICMHALFESCDPSTKLVFFLVGLFVGIWGIFVFVVRNKDLGLPGGVQQLPPQEPWNA